MTSDQGPPYGRMAHARQSALSTVSQLGHGQMRDPATCPSPHASVHASCGQAGHRGPVARTSFAGGAASQLPPAAAL